MTPGNEALVVRALEGMNEKLGQLVEHSVDERREIGRAFADLHRELDAERKLRAEQTGALLELLGEAVELFEAPSITDVVRRRFGDWKLRATLTSEAIRRGEG